MPLAFLILLYSHSYIIVDTIAIVITKLLFPKEEDFDKVMDDIEAMVGDVSNQVNNKSNDIINIMEKKKKMTKSDVQCPCTYGFFCVYI